VLSLIVDCGERPGELLMPVVMAGEAVRAVASLLSQGGEVRVRGSIRPARSRARAGPSGSGVEVVADEIAPAGTLI
jgi:single-stranded DNA-binding protein